MVLKNDFGGSDGNYYTAADANTVADAVNALAPLLPEDFDAVGDGATDDSTALQAMFDAAANRTVYLDPTKTYAHASVLNISVDNVTVYGGGILLATAEATSAIHIHSDYVFLHGVTLQMGSTTTRGYSDDEHKLVVYGDHFRATDVLVDGSAGGGVKMSGAHNYTLISVTVQDTRADGFHATAGSTDGVLIGCFADNTGDDGFAVVSYEADGVLCERIQMIGCRSVDSAARSFAVVGGADVQIVAATAVTPATAGLYIACEDEFSSAGVADVIVQGIDIKGANTSAPGTIAGAVLIYDSRSVSYLVERVTITGAIIRDTDPDSREIALISSGADNIRDIVFSDVTITGGTPYPFSTAYVPVSRYTIPVEVIAPHRRIYTTSAYTAVTGVDQHILVDTGGSVTLPLALDNRSMFTVYALGGADRTVNRSGSDTIDGGASSTVPSADFRRYVSDGATGWFTI